MASTGKTKAADPSLPSVIAELYFQLSAPRRRAFVALLALMLAGAVAEVVTIGALLPFLAIIANIEGSPVLALAAPVLGFFGVHELAGAVYLLTSLFALAVLVAAALRLLLLWTSQRFVNGVSHELSLRLYNNALHEPYPYHIRHNSSEIIAGLQKVEIVTYWVLSPLMQSIIALVMASFIIAGLVVIDPVVAFVAGVGFSAIYLLATVVARNRLKSNSHIISQAQSQRVKVLQEGLGGIRDVLIDQSQSVFVEAYDGIETRFRAARAKNGFLEGAPRFLVEALGMIVIALVAVGVSQRPGGLIAAIPVLGALALGAQRLLPLIQLIYNGWASTTGNRQVLFDVMDLLRRPAPRPAAADTALPFEKAIRLDGLGFTYAGGRAPALSDVNLDIPKGARVGVAGRTGSGKSTLMDLILGLLEPDEGVISIDGVPLTAANRAAWQKNVVHVPQAIYLADASVTENIAFGVHPDAIDRDRVRRAAEQAELAEVIAALPEGYDTRVGERGIQLSGGQRQRIGIARALYKQASVLVFDEATSALDTATEAAVMDAINGLDRNLTILIIAHRLSTLDGCDVIVRLEGGKVVERAQELQRFR